MLYLVIIFGALFAEVFVRQKIIVPRNPAATAEAIRANEFLFRAGFAVSLVYLFAHVPLALILRDAFARCDRTLATLMMAFLLLAAGLETVNLAHHYAPLTFLQNPERLDPASAAVMQTLAYRSFQTFGIGFAVALVFFAGFCVSVGVLVWRSRLMPRLIGALLVVAGVCYWVNSFALIVVPEFAGRLFPFILLPCLVAELSFALWLVAKGLRPPAA